MSQNIPSLSSSSSSSSSSNWEVNKRTRIELVVPLQINFPSFGFIPNDITARVYTLFLSYKDIAVITRVNRETAEFSSIFPHYITYTLACELKTLKKQYKEIELRNLSPDQRDKIALIKERLFYLPQTFNFKEFHSYLRHTEQLFTTYLLKINHMDFNLNQFELLEDPIKKGAATAKEIFIAKATNDWEVLIAHVTKLCNYGNTVDAMHIALMIEDSNIQVELFFQINRTFVKAATFLQKTHTPPDVQKTTKTRWIDFFALIPNEGEYLNFKEIALVRIIESKFYDIAEAVALQLPDAERSETLDELCEIYLQQGNVAEVRRIAELIPDEEVRSENFNAANNLEMRQRSTGNTLVYVQTIIDDIHRLLNNPNFDYEVEGEACQLASNIYDDEIRKQCEQAITQKALENGIFGEDEGDDPIE